MNEKHKIFRQFLEEKNIQKLIDISLNVISDSKKVNKSKATFISNRFLKNIRKLQNFNDLDVFKNGEYENLLEILNNINSELNKNYVSFNSIEDFNNTMDRFNSSSETDNYNYALESFKNDFTVIQKNLNVLSLKIDKELEFIDSKTNSFKIKYERLNEFDEQLNTLNSTINEKNSTINNALKKLNSQIEDSVILKKELDDSIKLNIEERLNDALELIEQARNALSLKETEGIAAAYSGKLEKITKSKTQNNWLIAASILVGLAVFLGFLLTGGDLWGLKFDDSNNDVGIIVGRIAVTGLLLSAAIFCSKQYINQKNLIEDYEYKVVLSKSILAFAEKIKVIDDTRVADYFNHVLKELHQDPLRARQSNKQDKGVSLDTVDKLVDVINKMKTN